MKLKADLHCGRCDGAFFTEGPHGGLTINVRCVQCGATYWTGPPGFEQSGETEQAADLFHGEPRTIVVIFLDAQKRRSQ